MSEQPAAITISAEPEPGSYRLSLQQAGMSVVTTAQELLAIARWVEQHRDRLRKEAGQALTRYRVALWKSRVMPRGSIVEMPIEALDAQEAASRALLTYGVREMALVIVESAARKEIFSRVRLQPDHTLTFEAYQDELRPQPPFALPFDPDRSGGK